MLEKPQKISQKTGDAFMATLEKAGAKKTWVAKRDMLVFVADQLTVELLRVNDGFIVRMHPND
ncbi:MAG TPA: hypothetical protein VNN25_08115 [Thermoanaerobaculia bacterium]|nr:hypothetical protein [Thermoanaerobaculia bacterium]